MVSSNKILSNTPTIIDTQQEAVNTQISSSGTTVALNGSAAMQEGNNDTLISTSATQNNSQVKQNYNQIYNLLETECSKAQIPISASELKRMQILEKAFHVTAEELEAKCPNELKKNIEKAIIPALKDAIGTDGKINAEKAQELANKYHVLTTFDWDSVESFKKYCNGKDNESMGERLLRFKIGREAYDKMTPEEREKAVKEYLKDGVEEKVKNYVKWLIDHAKKTQSDPAKLILQDISKLLYYTESDEERALFFDALKALNENEFEGRDKAAIGLLKGTIQSFDSKEECSHYIVEKNIVGSIATANYSKDINAEMSKIISENVVEEDAEVLAEQTEEILNKVFETNKDIIESIYKKIAESGQNAVLTPEEQAVKDEIDRLYTPLTSGQMVGFANNYNLPDEVKEKLLVIVNNNNRERDNYREVLESVYTLSDEISITPEKFTELMDKATNGNYSIVAGDIARNDGVKSKLNPPVEVVVSSTTPGEQLETVSSGTTSVQTSTSYVQVEQAQKRTDEIKRGLTIDEDYQDVTVVDESNVIAAIRTGNNEGVNNYLKSTPAEKALTFLGNRLQEIASSYVMDRLITTYKQTIKTASDAGELFENLKTSAANFYLAHTNNEIKANLNVNNNNYSFDMKQNLKEAKEEAREKEGLIG